MKKLLTLALLTCSTASFAADETAKADMAETDLSLEKHLEDGHAAHAVLLGKKGEPVGHAHFQQGAIGTLLTVKIDNLPAGAKGFHIHSVGTCDHHDHFKSASGHVDPNEKAHGFLNENGPEKGDLPNIHVHEDGTDMLEIFLPQLNVADVLDEDGSSLMIHENPDDHTTQPIGGAGARIACGVIKK